MIIANEITFMNVYDQGTYISWFIKLIITITTIILVGLVFYYHHLDLALYATNNSFDHWRIGLTRNKIFLILFEASICMIHPIPLYFPFISNIKYDNSTISNSISPTYITMDVALSLPSKLRYFVA